MSELKRTEIRVRTTPPALVEYVLAQTLTPEILATRPRVIDPACGSGIFLVESFRRMVRHLRVQQNGRRVSRPQLRKLLRDQILESISTKRQYVSLHLASISRSCTIRNHEK